jgi:hypothetical protein
MSEQNTGELAADIICVQAERKVKPSTLYLMRIMPP